MRFARNLLAAMLVAMGTCNLALAQAYPAKPVQMIVAFGAGSGTDVVTRYLADILSKNLNQRFVVENRVGAAGNIGMAAGAKAPNDGYTLVMGGLGVNAMNQFLYPPGSLGFEPEKDFDSVILVARLPFAIAVPNSFPGNSLADLIATAKAKPNSVNAAITTTTSRMVFELFNSATGAQLFAIAYKAPAAAMSDVIAGRVTVAIETAASLRSHVNSGNLKALAITSRSGSDLMPGLKSVAEQGVPNFEFVGWVSMYMPRGAPRDAINLINAELNKILALPDTKKRFLELGMEPGSGSPQDMANFENSERKRWGPVIRAAGLKAE